MATGLDIYHALRQTTKGLGSEFSINTIDARDLRKLQPSHLVSQGYDEKIAEEVSSALLKGDFGPLGKSMGLRLSLAIRNWVLARQALTARLLRQTLIFQPRRR